MADSLYDEEEDSADDLVARGDSGPPVPIPNDRGGPYRRSPEPDSRHEIAFTDAPEPGEPTSVGAAPRLSAPDERGNRYPVRDWRDAGVLDRAMAGNPQPRGPGSGGNVLPETPGQAVLRNGVMYNAGSGAPIASIGDAEQQQQAEQFGAQLPMTQREMQQLDQLRRSYGEVLRNQDIPWAQKQRMLQAMAREIHFGQSRLQYMQRQQRLDGQQERGAAQSEDAAHQMARAGALHHWSMENKVPDGNGGFHIPIIDQHGHVKYQHMPAAQVKPFSFSQANKEAEDELRTNRPDLFRPKDADQFGDAVPPNEQELFKNKYGKPGDTDESKMDAAAKGWAKEAETNRKRLLDEAMRQRVHEMRQAHGQPAAQSTPATNQAARSSPPNPAAGPAAPSGGQGPAPSGQPLFNSVQAVQAEVGRIANWSRSQMQSVEADAHPDDRDAKRAAVNRAAQLLAKRVHQQAPLSPAEAEELARLDRQIKAPHQPAARQPTEHERNSDNANQFAGGT